MPSHSDRPFSIVGLNYVSFYLEEFKEAIAFYTKVLGEPENVDEKGGIYGWKTGSTWLTLFPSSHGAHPGSNPRNGEFAVQVSSPDEVDVLYRIFLDAGAKECMKPVNTEMYESMRFCCVDDPFGIRVDIYCLLS